MAARFQQVRQQAQNSFQNDMRTLDADARALDSLRSSLPPAVTRARSEDIAQRRAAMKARGDRIKSDLADLDAQLTTNVTHLAEPAVRVVETQRGCSMLIARNTLLNLDHPSLDITPDVIDQLNNAAARPTSPER